VVTLIVDPLRTAAPAFVGREAELATLRQALAEPAVVLVEGEAGVGKSRLIRELLAGTGGANRALLGTCPAQPEPTMLGPIVAALQQTHQEVAGLPMSALAGALRPLFPAWATDLPPSPEPLSDPSSARHRLFRALADLLASLEVAALVIEDVHWADTATLEFLLFLASRWQSSIGAGNRQPGPMTSLVVTYRPEDVPAESLLLRLSSRLPVGVRQLRIPVPPLDQVATGQLVCSMLGGEPVATAFVRFLHERTDGVPLAVEESVRLLHARGDLIRRGDEWGRRQRDGLLVPPTIRELVRERVPRLAVATQRALQAVAVLAAPADETIVAVVAGLSDRQAGDGLAEAIGAGLLDEDREGRAGFRHVLMGQAVYEAIAPPDRRRLHLAAGLALEALDPQPLAQLTRHFQAAGRADKWPRYAELAADRASRAGDHDAALQRLLGALGCPDLPPATQVRLAHKLAKAASSRRGAVDDLHRQAVEALRTLLDAVPMDPADEAELRNGFGRLLAHLGELEAARAQIEQAVPRLTHHPVEAARAMRFLGLPFIGEHPAAVHRRWLHRLAQVDQRRLPAAERLALIVDRAGGLLHLGDLGGWAVAAELPATAQRADERRQVARGHQNFAVAAIVWGRYERARQLLRHAAELAEADRYLRLQPLIRAAEAQLDWYTGAWSGLTDRARAGTDPAEQVTLLWTARLGLWQLAQGAHRRAESQLTQALTQARRVGAVDDELEASAALGRLRLLQDRADDALAVTEQPIRLLTRKGVWVWATDLAPVRVQALLATGALAEAEQLVAAYRRGMRRCPAPAGRAALITCRALLAQGTGDLTTAAGRFAAAARAWQQLPRPYESLLARERQASCELAAGRERAALDRLPEIFRALGELGARGDAERIARLLHEHGVDVRRQWRRGRRGYGDQLSPRELDVVRLVATGATNREVAASLSRSPKTVAGQLSSAMRKLGATSRTELAVDAVRNGLVAARAEQGAPLGRPG
jgi:DNA-binding CsgD family transcriptional regulator